VAVSDALSLRQYEPADAARVWTVHEAALRASPLPFVEDAPADEDIKQIAAAYLDDGGEFLVGEADGEIVATGGFQPRDSATVEMLRMRVHPDHQGQGYGAAVLAELETRAREQGASRAVLSTNALLTAAQRLYERRGYEQTGSERTEAGDVTLHYEKRFEAG